MAIVTSRIEVSAIDADPWSLAVSRSRNFEDNPTAGQLLSESTIS
jgi:hypothetical protein